MQIGEVSRVYHQETNQGPRRRPRPVEGFVPMDPANRPLPFKRYPQARLRALPRDLPPTGAPAAAALSGRVPPTEAAVDLDLLARLLYFSAGVIRTTAGTGDPLWFRAAPSAGNLHPLEVYVVAGDVAGLDSGLYHFAPDVFGLEALAEGDSRAALAEAVADGAAAASPLSLVITGMPWRTAWKYGERGWRHVYWDSGTLLANLLAVAEGHRLPVEVRLGFVDVAVCRLLGIDGVAEFPVAAITLGRPTAPTPAGPAGPTRPSFAATDLSPPPVAFPLTTRVQQAGELTTAEEVVAWRARTVAGLSRSSESADPPATAGSEPIEALILRRGSTRRMRRQAAPAELLKWALAVATRHVPVDAVPAGTSLLTHEVGVHAVRGMDPGLYHRADRGLRLDRAAPEAEVRRLSEHLCLDQPLGGDSAYTDFACADPNRVLTGYGDRGYRVAQLEAGVAAGRLQLAAFALGCGGTGLTFYDEEIREAFATPAACMLAVSIGVPAYRAKPGGPPGRPTRITG
ncbi:SagB-type dehydrogenase domain-containing protein [Micromonospora rhizosphaerae]|uniref:SagB-type dehydrogenase domain-containing protein n=1 Tax=Micromonospora rhizosphaerae TaxID=568872 RepID=A0A1C6SNH8_9ACTN|nr:SagB family peptide dehydrogenase [Micromonospora rhizosphaerae]SCL31156.1 SagB-type dehydrogenase domain-containing protein [Micromonospora rhizosphaerae]